MPKANILLTWARETLDTYRKTLILSKSKSTVDAYCFDVAKFFEYLQDRKIKRATTIKPEHITDYLGACKLAGKSDASLTRYYMSIRCFCKWLRKTKATTEDLTFDIQAPRNTQKAPKVMTIEEVNLLLAQPDTHTETGLRDRAILELLYSSGLRATELCKLQVADVRAGQVRVKHGKRGKTRTIPLTDSAWFWVEQYLQERDSEQEWLFLTKQDKPLCRQQLCGLVSSYAKQAGIEGVSTHTLRHACATHLLDNGADLRLIQEVLGHSSIATTQRYTHLSSSKMQVMFKNFHPRDRHGETFNN